MNAAEKYQECVRQTADFVAAAGFSDVVIGLSGGIDSSLVTVMAADALGAHRVHGVLLPGPYSTSHSVEDALDMAERIGIETDTVSICGVYEAFANALAEACGGELSGFAAENVQARCRMVCIMALSNAHGWMMLNTGNKSEACMGYSTLYGDMAGAFAPIGALYKTDVYELARWRNAQATAANLCLPIPERVLEKAPSAELAPNQEDETSLGIEYAELDRILLAHIEGGLSEAELLSSGFSPESVENVLRRFRASAFKRALEPPCPQAKFY